LLTGERSALIKALLALMIFYSLSDTFKIKEKVILLIVIFTISISILSNSAFLKSRWVTDNSLSIFKSKEIKNTTNLIKGNENLYLTIYRSGLTVWKNYPLFGVGNKNYRIMTCKKSELIKFPEYICGNHPHQIYLEFLTEHGIIGGLILLIVIFNLLFKNLPIFIKSKNYMQLGCFVFLLNVFLPIIPSGAFFGDFSSNFFWINMSILYASNPKTNIFRN
jgi:O-antigen ligase